MRPFLPSRSLALTGRDPGWAPFLLSRDEIATKIAARDEIEFTKGLSPIFRIIDVRDFPAVDFQAALAPRRNVYFKFVGAE